MGDAHSMKKAILIGAIAGVVAACAVIAAILLTPHPERPREAAEPPAERPRELPEAAPAEVRPPWVKSGDLVWRLKPGFPKLNLDTAKWSTAWKKGDSGQETYSLVYVISPENVVITEHGERAESHEVIHDWKFIFKLKTPPAVLWPDDTFALAVDASLGGTKHFNDCGAGVRFATQGIQTKVTNLDGKEAPLDEDVWVGHSREKDMRSYACAVPKATRGATISIYSIAGGKGWLYQYEYAAVP
jgi:hypothetical protein